MHVPPIPSGENERLRALQALGILDTQPESRFDRVTKIAASLFNVPIALVTLVDQDRQWFKSRLGLAVAETPRSMSFCGHAILCDRGLVVPDTLDDPRFSGNPLVTGPPNIRFYAGIPLATNNGRHRVGTLCIIDTVPRQISDQQLDDLATLAAMVEEELTNQQLAEMTARYLAEQNSLLESEDLLRTIVRQTPGMLGYWSKELICQFANPEYLAWFGRTPEQMLGIHIRDLLGEELFRKNEPYILAALNGQDQQFERTLTKTNGDVAYTLARYTAHWREGQVQGMLVLVTDITPVKHAYEQLQLSEARINAMMSAIPDIVFIHRRTGEIVDFHAPDWSLLFMQPSEFLHRKIDDILPQSVAQRFLSAFADAIDLQSPQEVFYSLPIHGKEVHFEARVARCTDEQVIAIVRNVTEQELDRRNREEYAARLSDRLQLGATALRERERMLALAADAATLGFWDLDLIVDRLQVSEQWSRQHDYSPAQQLNQQSMFERIHREDVAMVKQSFERATHADGHFEHTYRIVLPDNQLRWMASRGRIEFDHAGEAVSILGVSVDVTARKAMELDVLQKHKEITYLSRLATMGELSGALAHELNQPLTAILSNAQAAQRFLGQGNVGEVSDILRDIIDENKRAGEVIRRLRRLFDKSETEHQVVDLIALIVDVVHLLRNDLINRDSSVITELAPNSPMVSADPVQLQQILINLIMNACDAMSESAATADKRVIIRMNYVQGDKVQISVIDRGAGIATANLERIFEPFFTTKANGMGLGLSICRSIAYSNGGQLWAENNPDQGAGFHLRLPLLSNSGGG